MSLADLSVRGGELVSYVCTFLSSGAFKSSREKLSHHRDWLLSLLISTQFSAILLMSLPMAVNQN